MRDWWQGTQSISSGVQRVNGGNLLAAIGVGEVNVEVLNLFNNLARALLGLVGGVWVVQVGLCERHRGLVNPRLRARERDASTLWPPTTLPGFLLEDML